MPDFSIDPLNGKTLLIGIGAQKAGTSWLYRQMSRDYRFCMPIKELHFFDSMYRSDLFGEWPHTVLERLKARAASLTLNGGSESLDHMSVLLDHFRMMENRSQYLEIFRNHIRQENQIFGEITPSYAALNLSGFKAMRATHDSVKLIFILRDPVSRLISSVRHGKRLLGEEATAEDVMLGLNDQAQVARCSYNQTLDLIDKVFQSQDVFVTFIENIFTEKFVSDFGKFLGIDRFEIDINDTLNVFPAINLVSEKQVDELRTRLDYVYQYCSDRFRGQVPMSWGL